MSKLTREEVIYRHLVRLLFCYAVIIIGALTHSLILAAIACALIVPCTISFMRWHWKNPPR